MSYPNRPPYPTPSSNRGWGHDDDTPAPRRRMRSFHPVEGPEEKEPVRPDKKEEKRPRKPEKHFGQIHLVRDIFALIGFGTVLWLAARYVVIPALVMFTPMLEGIV